MTDVAEEDKVEQPIIIKKIKKGGGHHGGAWKVAYADFVTAMMAFFLLLWLLNVTTEDEKNAISNYFDPTHPKVSSDTSGAGGVLGGLSVAPKGAMVSNVQPITASTPSGSAVNNRSARKDNLEQAKEKLRKQEEERMQSAKAEIEKAIESDPELKELKDQLLIDMTPEGLRIQVIDKEGKPMFASGSARMFEKTRKLLEKVTEVIKKQPNELSVRGHTDSVGYGPEATYTNWELSADRANSSRRVMLESGFPPERINNVVGKADTEHLIKDDPKNASNRRISIILLKEELTNPDFEKKAAAALPDIRKKTEEEREEEKAGDAYIEQPTGVFPKMGTFKKTPGAIEFP
ncbi:MAG TPA: flagellar motor protein MotB [Alphaproteobacteria bacterium]|nr:flagellar motor protein MotB [Alphaproteobacteria bacterium]